MTEAIGGSPMNGSPKRTDAQRQADALALHVKGWSYRAIAAEVGYADHTAVVKAVKRAMTEIYRPSREEARDIYLEKFDRLERAAWPDALAGSAPHQRVVLETMRDRARMFGLDDPTQVEVNLAPVRDLFTQLIPLDEPEDAELVEDAEEVPPDDDDA